MSARIRRKSQLSIAREGFLDRRSKRCFWLLLSPQTKVARAGARNYPCAADNSEGRGAGTLVVFGDYQIAPIAARSTAMGRWRLTPPWYGDAACGRDRRRKAPHPSRLRRATCLPAGRSVRGSDTPTVCHSTPRTPQGEGLGVRRQERKISAVAEASGRVSLRAGERTRSPFD